MKGWLALVKTTVRSSFRNRAALIFTLLIPIFLMVLLGNVLGGGNASVNIGIVNNANNTASKAYIDDPQAREEPRRRGGERLPRDESSAA